MGVDQNKGKHCAKITKLKALAKCWALVHGEKAIVNFRLYNGHKIVSDGKYVLFIKIGRLLRTGQRL